MLGWSITAHVRLQRNGQWKRQASAWIEGEAAIEKSLRCRLFKSGVAQSHGLEYDIACNIASQRQRWFGAGLFMVGVLLLAFTPAHSKPADRRYFVAARMPDHHRRRRGRATRLWREKRGEVEPEDLSDNLIRPAHGTSVICGLYWRLFRSRTPASLLVDELDAADSNACLSTAGSLTHLQLDFK